MNININIDISEMYASATRKKIVKLGGGKLSTSVFESYQLKRRVVSFLNNSSGLVSGFAKL